ncbi:NAD(P)H-dependent oxidoreductase [Rickettsiales bacterium LUAb2]
MKNILLINGKKSFGHSKGSLNDALVKIIDSLLTENNFKVVTTNIDDGYNVLEEVDKYLLADIVIYQMPGWWMGAPWIVKKYIDEVFTGGHGKLYANDGRSHNDVTKKYGSGGLINGKKYMISVTWNAPISAFNNKEEFFEGAGVDGVYLPFHKANQFLGMSPLPTFICNDVVKNPTIEQDMVRLKEHLYQYIIN